MSSYRKMIHDVKYCSYINLQMLYETFLYDVYITKYKKNNTNVIVISFINSTIYDYPVHYVHFLLVL
jgi:hypothetical protein